MVIGDVDGYDDGYYYDVDVDDDGYDNNDDDGNNDATIIVVVIVIIIVQAIHMEDHKALVYDYDTFGRARCLRTSFLCSSSRSNISLGTPDPSPPLLCCISNILTRTISANGKPGIGIGVSAITFDVSVLRAAWV